MKRLIVLALASISCIGIALLANRAESQPSAKSLVQLQSTTPGTPQTGHANLTGTIIGGQFIGSGSGLTGLNASSISLGTLNNARLSSTVAILNIAQTFSAVKTFSAPPLFSNLVGAPFSVNSAAKVTNLNADTLDGFDSSAFLTGVPVPLTLTGDSLTQILSVTNTSGGADAKAILASVSANSGRAIQGVATSGVGTTYGVYGEAASTDGRGVFGLASAGTGPTYGGRFEATSSSGRGVAGVATSPTGVTFGVLGSTASPTGYAVYGESSAATGLSYGGYFEIRSTTNNSAAVRGEHLATTGNVTGVYGRTRSSSGAAVKGEATHATGSAFGGEFHSAGPNGTGVYATGGVFGLAGFGQTGVHGQGNSVGVDGVTTPGATGSTYGGYFQNTSSSGAGAIGSSGLSHGLHGLSSATGRAGVLAENTGTGTTYGVRASVTSTSGLAALLEGPGSDAVRINNTGSGRGLRVDAPSDTAIWATTSTGFAAVDARNTSSTGIGVFGNVTSTTGDTSGVRGSSASSTGRGVYGQATATSGVNSGVYGTSASSSGRGVYGEATWSSIGPAFGVHGQATSGSGGRGVFGHGNAAGGRFITTDGAGAEGVALGTSNSNFGGWFESKSTSGVGVYGGVDAISGVTYGVYGQAAANPGAFAIWGQGTIGSSVFKAFRIDHPEDPANKYLLHYSAESPEVLNIYSGKVTLDSKGEATVEMPSYFARINRDPRYSLTPIGAAMPNLHVEEEISEAALSAAARMTPSAQTPIVMFRIAGGAPGKRVSWEVKAVRNDRQAQETPARVEVDKVGIEAGRLMHPELYGLSPNMGMPYGQPRQ